MRTHLFFLTALLLFASVPLTAQTDTAQVKVSFDNADLAEVAQTFAVASQVPIVVMALPDTVRITGEQEGPWLEVLAALLEPHGLVMEWTEDGLALRIRPKEVKP